MGPCRLWVSKKSENRILKISKKVRIGFRNHASWCTEQRWLLILNMGYDDVTTRAKPIFCESIAQNFQKQHIPLPMWSYPLQQGKQRQPEKKPENFRRTGSGVGFQKRDWQWGSQSMIPHKSESKPRRDSHSSSNFGPEKNGKVGRMIIAQRWFLLLFFGSGCPVPAGQF